MQQVASQAVRSGEGLEQVSGFYRLISVIMMSVRYITR